MKRIHQEQRSNLYLKQGVLSLILLIFSVYLCSQSSLIHALLPPVVSDITILSSSGYVEDNPIVQLTCETIHYTGYDNYSKDNVTGHYYYTTQNNRCLFLLLDKSEGKPEETIHHFKGTAKLIQDESLFTNLTANLSKDMEWSASGMQKVSIPVIASQPDYHFMPSVFMLFGYVICFLMFGYSVLHNFYYYYKYH